MLCFGMYTQAAEHEDWRAEACATDAQTVLFLQRGRFTFMGDSWSCRMSFYHPGRKQVLNAQVRFNMLHDQASSSRQEHGEILKVKDQTSK